jgi:large subunit ribosomal protein L24
MHIKTNDIVEIIAGDDKGMKAKVLRMVHETNKLVVEGVNRVFKHVKRSQKNPQGGRLSKEMPVPISNVLLVCNKCNRGVRTGSRYAKDGSKERFCRKCGGSLGVVAPPRRAYASK